jgi:hypothetical protein
LVVFPRPLLQPENSIEKVDEIEAAESEATEYRPDKQPPQEDTPLNERFLVVFEVGELFHLYPQFNQKLLSSLFVNYLIGLGHPYQQSQAVHFGAQVHEKFVFAHLFEGLAPDDQFLDDVVHHPRPQHQFLYFFLVQIVHEPLQQFSLPGLYHFNGELELSPELVPQLHHQCAHVADLPFDD